MSAAVPLTLGGMRLMGLNRPATDLKQKTMKQMHGGEGEELLHKEDTEVVCRLLKKKPGGTETLNPLKVFVDSSCRMQDIALGCFDPLSLVLRRSVPFWQNFSILDIEVLTPSSPSALQVHTFTISRVSSESQNSVYLNNFTNKSTSIDE